MGHQVGREALHLGRILLILALSPIFCSASGDPFKHPGLVVSPCDTAVVVDTTGWQTIRISSSRDNRRYLLRMPATFERDSTVNFDHGGIAWADLTKRVMWYNGGGGGCGQDEPLTMCLQCEDSLSGIAFSLVSRYNRFDQLHGITAERYHKTESPFGYRAVLFASSPDSSDQHLLLKIIRSIQEEVWYASRGVLFIGGRRIHPPFTLKTVSGRIVINGHYVPDVLPPPTLPPSRHAELETRRAIQAHLIALRDSLATAGVAWSEIKTSLREFLNAYSIIEEVREGDRGMMVVVWRWGYQYLHIPERNRPWTSGSGRTCWEDTYAAISERLDYLRSELELGNVAFLLGGGAEHIVTHEASAVALEGVAASLEERPLTDGQQGLLPEVVRQQLLTPVDLEPE